MSKLTKIVVVLFVVLAAISIFYALNTYIYFAKQDSVVVEPYQATLTGEYLCLPHIDLTGPQTDECATGMRTSTGEYYAVDTGLMSQIPPDLGTGDIFTASGVITPVAYLSSEQWQQYPIVGIFSITNSVVIEGEEDVVYECDGDAMMCADGSTVGRTGPDCEFAACPTPDATSSQVTTYLGGSATAMSVTVSPQEVVSDSRCPAEVTCVWAGTVEVRTILATPVANGEHILKLGEPQPFGDYTVTLTEVTPEKSGADIPDSSYRFTYTIVNEN